MVLASLAGAARAQDGGFALDHFEPAPAGDAFFGVPSPYAAGHLATATTLGFDYARWPIRLRDQDVAVVSSQAFMRLDLSLALWERLLVTAHMPFAVMIAGDDPGFTGVTFTSLQAPQRGDLRLGARVRILGDDGSLFQLGAGGYFFAPTGSQETYGGDGAVRGQFHALVGGRVGDDVGFLWTASAGVEVRASESNAHAFTFGAAGALLLADDMVQIGPELYGQAAFGRDLALSSEPVWTTPAGTNAELLFGAKLRVLGGLCFGAAVGPGLGSAVGTPVVRAVGTLGWSPLPAAAAEQESTAPTGEEGAAAKFRDRDNDGISDDTDACPGTPGQPDADPSKDGCPPSDRDGDGIRDAEDACASVPGVRNVDATRNGCPEDRDGDGVADAVDACPGVVGVASDDPKSNGCPSDRDGDGVADSVDACPDAKGEPSSDPKTNGCPKGAASEPVAPGAELQAGEPVLFPVAKWSFVDIANPPGDKLALAIRNALSKPEVDHIEVQGHTDDSREDAVSDQISLRRAETVRGWLVVKGVPADKLVAKGYGATRPIADNRERQGRDKNRRVQLVLVKRAR